MSGPWARVVRFALDTKAAVLLVVGLIATGGLFFAPFGWDLGDVVEPVSVDAIPDVGENQQIVFTEWPGHAPRDVEDQVTYPLATSLLGLAGVRTVRSQSMFGFSSIYVIFDEGVDFYESRARLSEKLASLPSELLPSEARPSLGPDSTALGQVFWYTLEGHDERGELVGGWDLHELRTLQDYVVAPALQAVPGVSEVASIGGHVVEYHVDADPELLRGFGLSIEQLANSVRAANVDVGARTIEVNAVEYVVRGLGQVESARDLESAVIAMREGTSIRVRDVASVSRGPAPRRGILDDSGAEVVGGVVVVRFGANPQQVIERVKEAIAQLEPSLPSRSMDEATTHVRIVPFYDRTELIDETLGTLSTALWQQLLITLLVILVMLRAFRASLVVAMMLPLGVAFAFVCMKAARIEANAMALAGIAIAIGTMVDVGIVFSESILRRRESDPDTVVAAIAEVAPAVLSSVLTTVISFLPVFALSASEGKLFRPLAFTKTFAMAGAFLVGVVVVPVLLHAMRARRLPQSIARGLELVREGRVDGPLVLAVVALASLICWQWSPLGSTVWSAALVIVLLVVVLGGLLLFQRFYGAMLQALLAHRQVFGALCLGLVLLGLLCWRGASGLLGEAAPDGLAARFPGLHSADMPAFDEGSFLYMPSTLHHASIGQAKEMLQRLDAAIASIPEVDRVVGKLGRAESALDPAPISMFETLVTIKDEYDEQGGQRTRQWRPHIRSSADIWNEIRQAARMPGLTGAPLLQPISTRLVMLQTGMRARMGLKLRGPSHATLERFGLQLEQALRELPELDGPTVLAERVVAKPYLEVELDREALAAYGLSAQAVHQTLATAVGGRVVSYALEGRARRAIRVRFAREERGSPEAIEALPVATGSGELVPLGQLAIVRYVRGPQSLKSEDSFPTTYLTFDAARGVSEPAAAEAVRARLEHLRASEALEVPEGVSWRLAGSWENQERQTSRLLILVPIALALVLVVLLLQFRSLLITGMVLTGVLIAASGAMVFLWLWGDPALAELLAPFGGGQVAMTVGVWVGFIALFGIVVDDGVLMATQLGRELQTAPGTSVEDIRRCVRAAGERRIRACLMTTATTLLALLPVITATGRGSDLMRPMALPMVGGMAFELLTLFVVPLLYSAWCERRWAAKTA